MADMTIRRVMRMRTVPAQRNVALGEMVPERTDEEWTGRWEARRGSVRGCSASLEAAVAMVEQIEADRVRRANGGSTDG